jgi:hypothetical protein
VSLVIVYDFCGGGWNFSINRWWRVFRIRIHMSFVNIIRQLVIILIRFIEYFGCFIIIASIMGFSNQH